MSFSNSVAIAGVGETDYSRESGRSELTLSLQAIQAALDDANVEPREVDGLMKWYVDTSSEALVASNLGIRISPGSARSTRPVMSARRSWRTQRRRSIPVWRTSS